jgi:hypothetical protein
MAKLICLLFLFTSCSAIQVTSSEKVPVSFKEKEEHTKDITIEVRKDFFLWGLVPSYHNINIADEVAGAGYDSFAEVKVKQHNSFTNLLYSVLTFGFWVPKRFTIEGKAPLIDY